MSNEPERAIETDSAPQLGEPAGPAPNRGSERRSQSPLITAVVIENFKGVGRPVRIDLRPITLLFGRNSAGKSTVLHALCYAHEILSHGNVDAAKTDPGGDQIELAGFRNLVHAHDLDRDVRLRFELNLDNWGEKPPPGAKYKGPSGLLEEKLGTHAVWFVPAGFRFHSGWVEVIVTWSRPDKKPVLASYEVGVNESLVGRIRAHEAGNRLEFNWTHPMFAEFRSSVQRTAYTEPTRAGEGPDPKLDGWRLHVVRTPGRTVLPDWEELLDVDDHDLKRNEDISAGGWSWDRLEQFRGLISEPLVGIGQTLRDELAELRYIGPVRNLRPPTLVEPGSRTHGSWSDGSNAWNLLLHGDRNPSGRDLLKDVNDWLVRDDRLETGYRLQRRETVELPATAASVSAIRYREWLSAKYPKSDGTIDLDGLTRDLAARIVAFHGGDQDEIAVRIKEGTGGRPSAEKATGGQTYNLDKELMEAGHERHQQVIDLVSTIDNLEKGRPASAVKRLVRAIAAAPLRTTLQLVTAGSELPVRTPDIGVGISQILPVVVAALDPHRPGITAIEQPELHLHPAMQVELGDLFAQPVDDGRVFLLENHSEHLMLRLLRRIEETHSGELPEGKPALRPDQVSVVFLEQVDGEVRATRLRIDETGEFIDRWPHGFFDERADELF